jgi:hypothetical protein
VNHVKILGVRSMVLATFAMTHAFWPAARYDNSILAWGTLLLVLAAVFALSARVSPGPHAPFIAMMAVVSALVGAVAIVGGLIVGSQLLAWAIVIFGVLTGISEVAASRRGHDIPRHDHLILGGATLMLAFASLIAPLDSAWLSGTMVAWAAIGAVLAGTASVGWKDRMSDTDSKEILS